MQKKAVESGKESEVVEAIALLVSVNRVATREECARSTGSDSITCQERKSRDDEIFPTIP